MERRLLIPLICTSFMLQLGANAQLATTCTPKSGFGAQKIYALEQQLRQNEDPDTIKKYVNTQKRRSTYFKIFKRDNIEACDNLRAALYFLRQNKNLYQFRLCRLLPEYIPL